MTVLAKMYQVVLPAWAWWVSLGVVVIVGTVTGFLIWYFTRRKGPPPLPRP